MAAADPSLGRTPGKAQVARGDGYLPDLDVSAVADYEAAARTTDGDPQKAEATLEPRVELSFESGWRVTAIGRLRGGPVDRLEPGQPSQDTRGPASERVLLGNDGEAELRELYLDGFIGGTFVRLGKQQVVWGQADGLKVLDIVDPQSFREFILPPFDESRIPLWTANAEVPVGEATLQLLWVPDQTYHDLADPDAEYAFTAPRVVGPTPPPGVPLRIRDADRPDDVIADSDAGARLSAFVDGWDLTANYIFQYDNQPVFRRRLLPGGAVEVRPEFERTHVLGGTFANAFGEVTVRGEAAYMTEKFFPTRDPGDSDGVVGRDTIDYVLGLDWRPGSQTFVSGQLFQSVVTDAPDGLIRDPLESMVTLLVRRTYWNQRLEGEVLWIQGVNDGDGVVSPVVRYQLASNVWAHLGADVFYGESDGLFGQFDDTDRLRFGFEVGF